MNPLERKQSLISSLTSVPTPPKGPVDRLPLWLDGRDIGTCYAHMTPRGMVVIAELEPTTGAIYIPVPERHEEDDDG